MNQSFHLDINGIPVEVDVQPGISLLELLRDVLGMTGTLYGCGESRCGTCTVLVDNIPTHSCDLEIWEICGRPVRTVEGLGQHGGPHPLQQAFSNHPMPCGNCIPGMIMSAIALLEANPHPTEAEILLHMSGNSCRCHAQSTMLKAILEASLTMA